MPSWIRRPQLVHGDGVAVAVVVSFSPTRTSAYLADHVEAVLEVVPQVRDVGVAHHLQEVEDDWRLSVACKKFS